MYFCFCLRGCIFCLEDVVSVGLGHVMVVHACERDRLSTCDGTTFYFGKVLPFRESFPSGQGGHSGRLTGAMAPRSNVH
jgi:hypothetical protein